MRDDDDALAAIDLAAWQPPPPPAGTADAVIARIREPAAASAIEAEGRPSRRAYWIGGLALVAAAAVVVTALVGTRSAPGGRGELVAASARHLALGDSGADLDAGAQVRWQRDRDRIIAHQARGTVRWTIAPDDTLVIDPGEPGLAATIEASGASLRMEVQMNLSDMRVLGVGALTAAAISVVTVVVYEGHVKATSGGQTVNVTPGGTIELLPGHPPQPPAQVPPDRPAEPVAVGAAPADVRALEAELRAAHEQIAQLKADLAVRLANPGPESAAARTVARLTAPEAHDEVRDNSPPAPGAICDTLNIDDVLAQAQNQYAAGFAKAALQLVKKSLQCQQSGRVYRIGAMYACAAHDVAAAREMFAKVPQPFQAGIVQRCQQENITLRVP